MVTFTKNYSWLVIGSMLLFIAIDVFARLQKLSTWSILLVVIIAAGAFRSVRKNLAERNAHHDRIVEDRTFWVEETNRKVFTPMAASRLISPIGGIASLLTSSSPWLFLLYPMCSAFLLLLVMPLDRHFIMTCKSCEMQTSLILKKPDTVRSAR